MLRDSGILDRTHIRWFTKASAIELMTGTGLALEEVLERVPDGKWKTIDAMTLGFFKRFFVLQNIIRVRNGTGH